MNVKRPNKQQVGTLLDIETYKRARARAILEGRNVGELIDDALRTYLAAKQPTIVRAKGPQKPGGNNA